MLQILITIFLFVLIPLYWKKYGVTNFLWFSDIGLFLTFFALWLKSPLLISMATIGILPVELIWIADYFFQLTTRRPLLSISSYMFDAQYSIFLRSLSLFHIALPIIWFWYLFKWGYDAEAFNYQLVLTWVVLVLSYFFTDPEKNINWIYLPKNLNWKTISSFAWLIILMIFYPLLIIWPTHYLLERLFHT